MTIAIDCSCGGEAVFWIDGQETRPTTECDECGQTYRMKVEKVAEEVRHGDKEPIALAYDDTDDELIAKLYTKEVVAECKDSWWIRVEENK